MSDVSALWYLLIEFAAISLLSVGGGITTIPEMHRNAVERHAWLTDRQFSEMFALAQALPGPTTVMFAALIGWNAAGITGSLVAILSILTPSCLLTYFVTQSWDRFRGARWREIALGGLVPVTVGLIFAAAYLVASGAVREWNTFALMALACALTLTTRLNLLWFIAGGALAGLAGFV